MSSTFTTNSYIGGKSINKSLWPMRLADATIAEDFKLKQPAAAFIYEIRVSDIGPAPQRFVDFDRNNPSGAMHESMLQVVFRTVEKVLQTYNDQSVAVPGGYPVDVLLEVVLRPEGEEEVDQKDHESRDARDLMADFVQNFYGKDRFDKQTVTMQTGILNNERVQQIQFMRGFDRRRVYAYRFHIFMLNTDVDFSAQMIGVIDIAIDLWKRHAGINNDEFAAARRNNKFAKAANGGGGGNGNNGRGGNDGNDASRNNSNRPQTTIPLSHIVTETERWKLIKSFNDYINVCSTYLRDATWFSEQRKRELLSKANPFTSPTNALCPLNVFGAQNYFRSAAEKQLPIDAKQLDIANYYSYEKEVGEEKSTIYAKFPYPNLVLKVPIDKLSSGIEIANMFLPDVQKRTIEPHLDLQRSVGGGIERMASASESLAAIEGAPPVDPDDDVDDKRPDDDDDDDDDDNEEQDEMVQRRRNAPLIRRGLTESADDGVRNPYESVVQASVERSLSIDQDDFSESSTSSVTVNGQEDDSAPFIGGRRLQQEASQNDDDDGNEPELAAAIRDARREANIIAARAQQQNMARGNDGNLADAQHHSHPLVHQRADIFAELTKHMGADKFKRPAPQHVETIDASYVMNGDFGDAKQMELNKAITSANEEGGINRTEHHLMRARILHGECKTIEQIPDAKQRTNARLKMQFRVTGEYRNKCGSSVSNISDPMKLINVWFENMKRSSKVSYRGEIRFCEETLSLFALHQVTKLIALEQFCFVYTAHAEIIAAIICAFTAYRYLFGLRLHPLLYGPAGSSKSEVLSQMEALLIKGTVEAVTNESQQADATEENENDVIRILHELPAAWVTKAQADAQKIEGLKNQMTAGISTRVVCDISNGQRHRVRVTSEKQIVYCAASNLDEDALEKAVRDRFLLFHQVKRHRPDCTIDQKIAQTLNAPHKTLKARQMFEYNIRLTQYNVAHAEKFIMIGHLCRPSIIAAPIILARYMQALEQCSGFVGDRRLSDKILSIARVLTIEAAITWVYRSPLSPCYNKEVDLWYLIAAEPWLKDTEEIAMYSIDVARSQCINPDQEQFFYAVREWVMPKCIEKSLDDTKNLCLFPVAGQTIFEVNNAHHQIFRRWHYDQNQSGINFTLREHKTTVRQINWQSSNKNRNQHHSIVGTHTTSSAQYAATTVASNVADAVQKFSVESAALNRPPAAPAIGVQVAAPMLQHGVVAAAAAAVAAEEDGQEPLSKEDEEALAEIDRNRGLRKNGMTNYNHKAASVAELARERHQKSAADAQYNWQYVSFFGTLTDFAAQVSFQNSKNKGARETSVPAIEKLCRRLTTCKITSKLYIPNPASYDPPVIIDESSAPTVQDMVILPGDNSCVYIHSSLVIGAYQDPHEIALRACASVFTPTARYLSAVSEDPSKPHIFKVRDVKPNDRANFTFSIDAMSKQAEILGYAREVAVEKGEEHDADDGIELDEDKMRQQKAIESDANSHKIIMESIDDYATKVHLRMLGMPVTPANVTFFNARINDNAARRLPNSTIKTPMKYPDDLIAELNATKEKQELLMREFSGFSLSELNLKRSRFKANIIDIEYDPDSEVADSITPEYEERHKLCAKDRQQMQIDLVTSNAVMRKHSARSLLRASKSSLLTPEVSQSGFEQQQLTTTATTSTTTAAAEQTFRVPTGLQRKMRKAMQTTSTTTTTTTTTPPANNSKTTTTTSTATHISALSSCESVDNSQSALDRLVDRVNANLAPIADPLMPRLKNTQHFINYENAMYASDADDSSINKIVDSIMSNRNEDEAPPLYD